MAEHGEDMKFPMLVRPPEGGEYRAEVDEHNNWTVPEGVDASVLAREAAIGAGLLANQYNPYPAAIYAQGLKQMWPTCESLFPPISEPGVIY